MKKIAAMRLTAVSIATPLFTFGSPVKVTALPSPLLIAAAILGLVAVFGAIFSLLLRKRSRSRVYQ